MTYRINKTDGSILADVLDETVDVSSSDIALIGKNLPFYGEYVNENFVKILENFASKHAPIAPITGQLWYDKTDKRLKVFDGDQFKTAGGAIVSSTRPEKLAKGDIWIDSAENQIHFYDGDDLILLGPDYTESQGMSGFTVATVVDANGNNRTIIKMWIGKTLFGILSKETTPFTLKEPIVNFSGQVYPGFNASDLAESPFRVLATSADAVYNSANELKTAEDFMLTDADTGTTGTVSIANKTALLLGEQQNNSFYVADDSFKIISNNTNQDFKISTSLTAAPAVYIDAELKNIGFFKASPTVAVDVTGAIKVVSLTMDGALKSSAVDLSTPQQFIKLNYGEQGFGVSEGYSNLYVDRGGQLPVSIRWNELTDRWELSVDGEAYSKFLTLSELSPLAISGSYNDLINVPPGFGSDAHWALLGNDISSTKGIRTGATASVEPIPVVEGETPFVYAAEIRGAFRSFGIAGKSVVMSDNTIDLTRGNYFVKTVTSNGQLLINGVAPSATVSMFVLEIVNGGSAIMKWPAFTRWSVSPPSLSSNGTDVVGFYTLDAGLTWIAVLLGLDVGGQLETQYWLQKLSTDIISISGGYSGISTDPYGNSYIVATFQEGSTTSSVILKLNPYGAMIWQKSLDLVGSTITVNKVVSDETGAYILGKTESSGTVNGLVVKVAVNGSIAWQNIISAQYLYADILDGAVQSSQLYVVGTSKAFDSSSTVAVMIKFSIAGLIMWQRALRHVSGQNATGVSITRSSTTFYLTGVSTGNTFVAKYNDGGIISWQKTFVGLDTVHVLKATADSTGNVYICGTGLNVASNITGFVAKISATGEIVWNKELTWTESALPGFYASCTGISVNTMTNKVGVTGYAYSSSAPTSKVFVTQITSSGLVEWARLVFLSEGALFAKDLIIDTVDAVHVVASSPTCLGITAKLPSDGSLYSSTAKTLGTSGVIYDVGDYSFADSNITAAVGNIKPYWAEFFDSTTTVSPPVFVNSSVIVGFTAPTLTRPQGGNTNPASVIKFGPTSSIHDQFVLHDFYDNITAMAVDSVGNYFIATSNTNATGYYLYKVTPTRHISWYLSIEQVEDIKINSGNIYVISRSQFALGDVLLRKLNGAGSVIWTIQIGTFSTDSDLSTAMSFDSSGNIFISSKNINTSITLIKLSPTGNKLWELVLESATVFDSYVTGTSVNLAGETYILVTSAGWTTTDSTWVIKISALGVLVWQRKISVDDTHRARLAVDLAGNAFVVCNNFNDYGTDIIQVDVSGRVVWTKRINNLPFNGFVSINSSDEMVIAGNNDNHDFSYVIKIPSTDNIFTTFTYIDAYSYIDVNEVNVDVLTTMWAVSAVPSLFQGVSTSLNLLVDPVSTYSSSYTGIVIPMDSFLQDMESFGPYPYNCWLMYIPSLGNSVGFSLSVDDYDNAYMSASVSLLRSANAFVSRISSTGVISWQKTIGSIFRTEHGLRVVVNSAGSVYAIVVGIGVVKLDINGDLLWEVKLTGSTWAIVSDTNDNVIVAGSDENSNTYVMKISSTGTIVWKRIINLIGNQLAWDLFITTTGFIYVTGYLAQSPGYVSDFVIKLTSAGDTEWARSLSNTEIGRTNNVIVDDLGNVYVSGSYKSNYIFVNKFDSLGMLQWSKKIQAGIFCYDMTADNVGNLYLCSYISGAGLLIKVTPSGDISWMRRISCYLGSSFVSSGLASAKAASDGVYFVLEASTITVLGRVALDGSGIGRHTLDSIDDGQIYIDYLVEDQILVSDADVTWESAGWTMTEDMYAPDAVEEYSAQSSGLSATSFAITNPEAGPLTVIVSAATVVDSTKVSESIRIV